MINRSPFTTERLTGPNVGTDLPEPVRTVKSFMKTMQPIHHIYQRQWFLNISNYVGNQNIIFDRITGRFQVPPAPSWRVRLIVNKILPIARAQMAKLLQTKSQPYVVPASNEETDREAAQMSTKFCKSIKDNEDFEGIEEELVHWQVLCGNVWLFPLWDANAGKQIEDVILGPDGKPLSDETGNPMVRTFSTGDIVFDVADPFEVIPDFGVTRFQEMSGIVKHKVRSVEYVKEKYNLDVEPEQIDLGVNNQLKTMAQATNFGFRADVRGAMKNAVMVADYYQNPTKKYPRGRHIVVARDKVAFEGPLETKLHGEYHQPGVHYGAIRVPKRLLYMSPVENLLPIQWKYNRARSQIIEDINLLGRPKLFAPIDSLADGAVTDQPGEVVEYDPASGQSPFYQTPSGPPAVSLQNIEKLEQEMQDVGGVQDISFGKLPRRATSGLALNILEEKDNTIIAPMKDSLKRGHQKAFSIALQLAKDNFKETRQMKIVGRDNEAKLMNFNGADLGGDDVKILIDEAFPQSRAAKLEFAQALVKEGIISPSTARRIIELDSFANLDEVLLDEEQQRIVAAQAAQQQLANPLPPAGEPPAAPGGPPLPQTPPPAGT